MGCGTDRPPSAQRISRHHPQGVEGNISAYFGLLAAGRKQEAAGLGNAIFQPARPDLNRTYFSGWDASLDRLRPGLGRVYSTALDEPSLARKDRMPTSFSA